MSRSLSIVIPVYNERDQLAETIDAVGAALANARGRFDAEIVVADDGSTDGSADVARATDPGVPVRVVSLERNRGRFEARKAGLDAATSELVLFLDTGVLLGADALAFVADELDRGRDVWNGHTHMDAHAPLARFWGVVNALAYWDYLREPRTVSYSTADFDRYPKGFGCFLAPRALFERAFTEFRPYYADTRHANDDAPILRAVARERPIWISPEFDCTYRPRTSLRSFTRHALHRGVVFVDGHGRRESRFFPLVVAFYPLSVVAAAAVLRRPSLALPLVGTTAVAAGVAAATRSRRLEDVGAFALVAPFYAVVHGAGMWKGLLLAAQNRRR